MFKIYNITNLLVIAVIIIGFFATVYVFGNTPKTEGASILFLLPLSFTFCCVLFKRIIPYHRGGWGLKVLYFIIFIRYIIVPVLTCNAGSFYADKLYSAEAYTFAILMQVVELIVTCASVSYFFKKTYKRCEKKYERQKKHYYDDLGIGGIVVILLALFLIYRRGLGALMDSMRFLVLTEGIEEEAFYGYDIWLAHTMMAFLVIVMTGTFQKREDKKQSIKNIIIPLVFAFVSCAMSFGNNRMTTVLFAISALSVLLVAFPKRKTLVEGTLIPAFVVVIVSFTMIKNFGYDVSSGGNAGLGDDDKVSTLNAYVSTTKNLARAYDMYELNGSKMTVGTFFVDVLSGITVLQLPVFQGITSPILAQPSSITLASVGTEVVPMAGQALFYGGHAFGWLIDIIIFVLLVRLLLITDCYSRIDRRIGNKYLLTWLSIVFAMMMAYNLSLMWSIVNYIPFFTWCALYINRTFRINNTVVRHKES